jgi:hypothetical protein
MVADDGVNIVLMTIAIVLLILWALGFFALHLVGGLIHVLLVVALIVFVVNLVRGRTVV